MTSREGGILRGSRGFFADRMHTSGPASWRLRAEFFGLVGHEKQRKQDALITSEIVMYTHERERANTVR